jgi:hypothetical protein
MMHQCDMALESCWFPLTRAYQALTFAWHTVFRAKGANKASPQDLGLEGITKTAVVHELSMLHVACTSNTGQTATSGVSHANSTSHVKSTL